MAKKKISWANIRAQIKQLRERATEQNFHIDVSYDLNTEIRDNTQHRNDLNTPAIATYWGHELLQHYLYHNNTNTPIWDLNKGNVLIELNYYSYLNILEIQESNARTGNTTTIVDLITDSTDAKTGMDLDDWLDDNDTFKDLMQQLWNNQVLDIWRDEGKLVTRKRGPVAYDKYWNYEDYIFMIRVFDADLNLKIIFLVGTYADYI